MQEKMILHGWYAVKRWIPLNIQKKKVNKSAIPTKLTEGILPILWHTD
jgi:hypothetical protein